MNQSGGLIVHNPIDYYNENWAKYIKETINLDMSEQYNFFTNELNGTRILDFGCGSGRDSLYFKSLNYEVVATEPCENLRIFASNLIDQPVLKIDYNQIGVNGNYYTSQLDGIWACASLLHAPKRDMDSLLRRLSERLKKSGIIYCSFISEDSEKMIGQRFYNSYTYETFSELIFGIEDLYIRKAFISGDTRKGNDREWINFIVKKR